MSDTQVIVNPANTIVVQVTDSQIVNQITVTDASQVNQVVVNDTIRLIPIDYSVVNAYVAPAFSQANSAYGQANLAYLAANNVSPQIAPAFSQANIAYSQANVAYSQANLAYLAANNVSPQIAPAFSQANSAYGQANSAYEAANNVVPQIAPAFSQANSAFNQANSAFVHANAAFLKANNALPLTGGEIIGSLNIVGNLTLSGNTVIIEATRVQVDDPLLYLAGNNYVSDIVDIGFIANYVNATGSNVHTGLYREHADKMYYLFQGYDKEPINNHIGALSNNMTLAVLNADLKTSNLELGGINAISWITASYDKANLANQIGVSSYIQANLAYGQANSAFDLAVLAYNAANTADDPDIARVFDQANTAYNQANAAFSRANTGIYNSREINTNTILIPSDNKIFANGTINVELIVASSNVGKEFTITNIGTGVVTILPNGSDKILSYDSMILENQWSSIILTSTGTNWVIS